MAILWVLVEILAGVLLAGGVTAAVVVAGGQWGAETGIWVAWVVVAVCVALTVGLGERIRRRSGA
jgi:membrane protein implicated in regulation of membrane protease activity